MSGQPKAESGALTAPQASEVVRYWLASLQLEEALSARPRARRAPAGPALPRVDTPIAGQEYFKLALDGELARVLCHRAALAKALDAELAAFFETWLLGQYRRGAEDPELTHLLSFPVVHLSRGELAGLLRCGVRLRFGEPHGPAFAVPSRAQRRRKEYPNAPREVRLQATEPSARHWPFFIDTRLLNQQLGVTRESIDALFHSLRAEAELDELRMLSLVCAMLEREAGVAPAPEAEKPKRAASPKGDVAGEAIGAGGRHAGSAEQLIGRITFAVGRLLELRGARARVYPVAIVLDAGRARTTFSLQREMQALLDDAPERRWDPRSSLGAYLRGAAEPPGYGVQRGLFPGPTPSLSQRRTAEAFLGSRFTAVQGPPGTGKTTMILHLAAHALVQQVDALARTGTMGDALFVVTSTNNRAVDNVVDPLLELSAGGLPLALRAGNRMVCEQLLAGLLARTRTFLAQAQRRAPVERAAELTASLREFAQRRAVVESTLAPRERALGLQTRRSRLRGELEALGVQRSTLTENSIALAQHSGRLDGLRSAAQRLQQSLSQLCELSDAAPGLAALQAVDRHQRRMRRKQLGAFEAELASAGLQLPLGLPPALPPSTDPAVLMSAWQLAAEGALSCVERLQQEIATALDLERVQRRSSQLRTELDALASEPMPPEQPPEHLAAAQRALFSAAVALREAWAANHAVDLLDAVERALSAAREEGTLRSLFSDARRWKLLCQLFPLWGCTLLSLGNGLPAEAEAIAQLVIDEAGQCHPAYALSGLLRSRSVLVIGDVHQLEPVIDLEPDDDERVVQTSRLALPESVLAPYRVHAQAQCSVQRLADRAVAERLVLRDHFRCQPEIIAISDRLCGYRLQVHTPPQAPAVPLSFLPHAVSWIDIDGAQERDGGSWYNPAELEVTLELIQALLASGLAPEELAVITPYRGQLEQLRRRCRQLDIALDSSVELQELDDPQGGSPRGVGLGTVHRFQGGERSVVLFSTVVSQRSSLPFLDRHPNLLNVAVSRARHRLIALGNRALLATGQRTAILAQAAHPLTRDSFQSQLGLRL